jgi:GNAT superfamily N-acetyltransferase
MTITFEPLNESHFSLLLKWLEAPHVKKWWDQDVTYTLELVHKKYSSYVKGYKLVDGQQKPIQGFIIHNNQNPIGYIQIYNAYDFPRSKTLSGLPANLGAFDIFIAEESALQQGLGSKAILEFLKLHGSQYSHMFADPDSNNIAAVKAYEKAGFKRVSEQQDTGETWMLKDLSSRNDPLPTIQKLIKERYVQAKAIFWAGSVSVNQGTSASDLDLVIVFEKVAHAYREAFIYEGWPIDAFIHDIDTLRYFFEESRTGNGISGLCYMILNGREVTNPGIFSENVKTLAQEVLNAGPAIWDQEQINKERFLITDVLDDIKYPTGRDEQIASAAWLLEALGQFYFRSQNKWCASGKSIIRYLKSDNPDLALEFTQAFESLFQTGHSVALELLVMKILEPYGGLFWNGFRSDASKKAKILKPVLLKELKNNYRIYLGESDNEYASKIILKGLKAHNESKIGSYSRENFVLFVKNESEDIIAGLCGDILGELCALHLLWVDQEHRLKGVGKNIINVLEEYALSKKCKIIQLDTTEFQAKDFYKKYGYLEIATLDKGFMGYKQFIMRKNLFDSKSEENTNKILDELKSREPIFHHPEKFGKTKEDISKQICDEFWEVGASGNVYTKQDVIETLLERYNDPDHQDIWEAKNFKLTKIAPDHYLLTYILIQDKTRVTRRSTLWRRVNCDWKILYHQGTVIDGGSV